LNTGSDGECLLFPSKELRDWDLFTKFKKGDVIVSDGGIIAIFDHMENQSRPDTIVYQAIRYFDGSVKVKTSTGIGYAHEARLATQEEKDLFFKDLTKAGYSWNGEEVVPIFKKGDIVVSGGGCIAIVDHVGEFGSFDNIIYYQCCLNYQGELTVNTDVGIGRACACRYASTQDQERILRKLNELGYVLDEDTVIKKRFNPQTFEPFQKVLVRTSSKGNWRCTFFSHMINGIAMCSSDYWHYCIPYKLNEHLAGTSNDCKDFYKWWENE
jgi:preprotein translocase subunit YajC